MTSTNLASVHGTLVVVGMGFISENGAEKHHFQRKRPVIRYQELEFAELRPPVIVLDSDDVVLTEIAAGLDPDQFQLNLARVSNPWTAPMGR
jgi:hypothetical protein